MSTVAVPSAPAADLPAESPREAAAPEEGATLAAVDLGSNSFHLVVARLADDHVHVIDRLREPVRLAAGLGESKLLDEDTMLRALDCLGRFAQRLRHMPPGTVRAVGTNTLRGAHNGEEFRSRAEAVLGHPIEVIAGREEARLIYLGVAQGLGGNAERRLVVDIGGGSTELIIGRRTRPVRRESLYMGCVNMSRRFFPDGVVTRKSLRDAELEARVELEPHETRFRRGEWEMAVGCSGTIRAVATVCQAAGWCEHGITREALDKLRAQLVDAGKVSELKLKDLREDRVPVFAGGVAVLGGIFDALGVEYMDISDMALREGLLYDLVGRFRHEDARDRTVRGLVRRYRVDVKQGARVEGTARRCFMQVADAWEIAGERNLRMLSWAARLHELGLAVSHSQYHKHGAYVLENADMAGFSRQDQSLLAALVRGHRRKFPVAVMAALPGRSSVVAGRLCVLLRLAVLLHRGRSAARPPRLALSADDKTLTVRLPSGWLDAHPLTGADLEHEQTYLRSAGLELRLA